MESEWSLIARSPLDSMAETPPPGDKNMLLQAMGIRAEHPSIPEYIVRITYSHRYAIGNEELNFIITFIVIDIIKDTIQQTLYLFSILQE